MYQYTPLDYGFLGAGPLNTKPHSFFGTPYARLDINDAQGSDRPMESTNGAGVDESQPVAGEPDLCLNVFNADGDSFSSRPAGHACCCGP